MRKYAFIILVGAMSFLTNEAMASEISWNKQTEHFQSLDPVAEANEAAAREEWRFKGHFFFDDETVPGIECVVTVPAPLVAEITDGPFRITFTINREENAKLAIRNETILTYISQFNSTLLLHPNNPYRDICRPETNGEQQNLEAKALQSPQRGFRQNAAPSGPSLHASVRAGDLVQVQEQIAYGGDLEEYDDWGMTPILWAVAKNRLDLTSELADAGANLLARHRDDAYENGILGLAVKWGSRELIEELYTRGLPYRRHDFEHEPFGSAAKQGRTRVIAQILEKWGPPRQYVVARSIRAAIKRDDAVMVELLLPHYEPIAWDPEPSFSSEFDTPILHVAINDNRLAATDLLLRKRVGLDYIEAVNEWAQWLSPEMLTLLNRKGVDLSGVKTFTPYTASGKLILRYGAYSDTALDDAIKKHDYKVVRRLISNMKRNNSDVGPIVSVAAEISDDPTITRLLSKAEALTPFTPEDIRTEFNKALQLDGQLDWLRRGIEVFPDLVLCLVSTDDVECPLSIQLWRQNSYYRSGKRHDSYTSLLLQYGADPNENEGAPLSVAASDGLVEEVKTLIEAGGDPNIWEKTNLTPLAAAVSDGQYEIVNMLLDAGANPDVPQYNTGASYRRNVIDEALGNRNWKMVLLLASYGADLEGNKTGRKPAIIVAHRFGQFDTVDSLISLGANVSTYQTYLARVAAHGDLMSIIETGTSKQLETALKISMSRHDFESYDIERLVRHALWKNKIETAKIIYIWSQTALSDQDREWIRKVSIKTSVLAERKQFVLWMLEEKHSDEVLNALKRTCIWTSLEWEETDFALLCYGDGIEWPRPFLEKAIELDSLELVRRILSSKIDAPTPEELSFLLSQSIDDASFRIVKALLEAGANPLEVQNTYTARTSDDFTSYDVAEMRGNQKIIALLDENIAQQERPRQP